ncbi:MAG: glycosyltransferase family 2 protein [Candidatus Delongbacteria bacterium]|jgi:glycosyltransferase involved in cell wall biosynthesis|nr:glycosyltransferase family 2 protein [Candidatus Delongbacteria bacterium]
MTKKEISIVVPAYNEEKAISHSLDNFVELDLHEKYEIIYVNDGSEDRTAEIIKKYPVTLVNHNANKGYGAALKSGIRKASGEKVVILDSDGQHDPKYLEKLVSMLDDYDMVIGERESGSHQVKRRQKGKKLIKKIGEYLVEQKLPDYNSGFRGFDREIILSMLHMMPNGFSFSTTSTMAFLKDAYTIGTFPIHVDERVGRKSNVKFAKDGSKTILLLFRIIMLFNPLKIFFPTSIIIFGIGIVWGITGYSIAGKFPNSAILISIMGMFLFFIGLVADQIAILNRRPVK